MKTSVLLALLLVAEGPGIGDSGQVGPSTGPLLLAMADGFTIHAFKGGVQSEAIDQRLVQPGVVVFHTDRNTGKATWLLHTGTISMPTRRISFSVSRLLGLIQTDTQMAVALYQARRVWDRPPSEPSPDQGVYRLWVWEKASGKKVLGLELEMSAGRPEKVPDETIDLGVINKTKTGFSVLGTAFSIEADGSIQQAGC